MEFKATDSSPRTAPGHENLNAMGTPTMTFMSGGELHKVRRSGDAGLKINASQYDALVQELEVSGWRKVHNAPSLVVWKMLADGDLFCHVALDGSGRAVAWVSR